MNHLFSDYFCREIEDYMLEDTRFQEQRELQATLHWPIELFCKKNFQNVNVRVGVISIGPQDPAPPKQLWTSFCRDFVKDRVNADNSPTLDQLKANIRDAIFEILLEICQKVIENYLKKSSCEGHLNVIVFNE